MSKNNANTRNNNTCININTKSIIIDIMPDRILYDLWIFFIKQ